MTERRARFRGRDQESDPAFSFTLYSRPVSRHIGPMAKSPKQTTGSDQPSGKTSPHTPSPRDASPKAAPKKAASKKAAPAKASPKKAAAKKAAPVKKTAAKKAVKKAAKKKK